MCEKNVKNWNGRLFQELSFARKLFKFWIRKQCLWRFHGQSYSLSSFNQLSSDSELADDDNCAGVNNSTDTKTSSDEEAMEDSAVFHGKMKKRRNPGETLTTFLPIIQLSNFMFNCLNSMNKFSVFVWTVLAIQSIRSSLSFSVF